MTTGCTARPHNYPLPSGWVDAAYAADERLEAGWRNIRCAQCGEFGWLPPEGESP